MTFWIITSALALVAAAILVLALLRSRSDATPAAAYDLQVYRDQLKEVDRDLARGVIAQADAERVRAEVSRRILAADAELQTAKGGRGTSRPVTLAIAVLLGGLLIGGSLMLYRALGAPGYGDLALSDRIEMAARARAERPAQAAAEASLPPRPPLENLSPEYTALLEKLRQTVARRPNDLQGQTLLARNEAATGNFAAAHAAQAEVLRLKGDNITARDLVDYADMLILAAGGYVSPEAEAVLARALKADPRNGPARYYIGLMMAQTGRPDSAFRMWQTLLREGPADAPWIPPIRAQIEDMALRAGADFSLPPAPGPDANDIAAASRMNAEDRNAMIRSMVDQLSDRLAREGGPPADWARLISSLGVLGEEAQAIAIYNNARDVFAGRDDALDFIREGARAAGLIP